MYEGNPTYFLKKLNIIKATKGGLGGLGGLGGQNLWAQITPSKYILKFNFVKH